MVEIHNVNQQPGVGDWFNSLPFVTRYWFGATMACTLLGNFGVISPGMMVFSWAQISSKYELWRVFTCFCYGGPFEFDLLILVCTYLYNRCLFY